MEYAIKNTNGQYESIEFNSFIIQTEGKGIITLQSKLDNNKFADCFKITAINHVTKLDIPIASLKLVSAKPFDYTIPFINPRYYNKNKIEDFLYEITYGNIDYEYAYEYFKPGFSGCSSIRNCNWFGRNFDWKYDNQVQFIVHTPQSLHHHGVLGVSGIIPGIDKSNVDQNSIIIDGVDMFKLVPFYLLDGINDCGLFCSHNLVPLDNETLPTIEITALKEEKYRVCIPMLVRFILDKFSQAQEAIDFIKNYVTLYFSDEMIDSGYQSHFMIGDKNHTYIIEFINGEIKIINAQYITNFQIYNVQFDKTNKIIYPTPTQSGINKFGFGLERWDIITDNYRKANTKQGMEYLLNLIKYSNCYTEDFWISELVKCDDDYRNIITVDSIKDDCSEAILESIENYQTRDRDNPKCNITCHSSIYDIKDKVLYIKNQENDTEYSFKLN